MVTEVIVDFNLLILMIEVTVANNPIHPQYIGRNLILTLNTQFIFLSILPMVLDVSLASMSHIV